ncbi:hypothetical protein D9758_015134 [Tetrapyrgos nigripes]|uniref:ATP-dependent DNA helicase n=1 Tax=Tetrapyrgos nigripes TaxID=182062 RepID=A0A8H5FD64_9AGAR|nr:hypothetical protein D9758_015134 [Tetrapyrgos nigripes]
MRAFHCCSSRSRPLIKRLDLGGHRKRLVPAANVLPYMQLRDGMPKLNATYSFTFHIHTSSFSYLLSEGEVVATVPVSELLPHLSLTDARQIASYHKLRSPRTLTMTAIQDLFVEHTCVGCHCCVSVFRFQQSQDDKRNTTKRSVRTLLNNAHPVNILPPDAFQAKASNSSNTVYPPAPLDRTTSHKALTNTCKRMRPEFFEEAGCAVCGQLTPARQLTRLKSVKRLLRVLDATGVTRQERRSATDKIRELTSPVIDYQCNRLCDSCRKTLTKGKVPETALARGLWLGNVPDELSSLRYFEKVLVSRVRHTNCFVRIATGRKKMKAHVMAFETPIPKVYDILPPPREDVEEVLAIMWSGPARPNKPEYKMTSPFLVRRNVVKRALEWLVLNHPDYADVILSEENLSQYQEESPPCTVEYKHAESNKTPEGTSVFDRDEEDGLEGDCAFTVHGLTGERLQKMTTNQLRAEAWKHFDAGGRALSIGHSDNSESIWNNHQLYPKMFPWLFPYGAGGIGLTALSDKRHKSWLLMYHDKRFQKDPNFPFVAFSHAQIKATTTSGFLMAERKTFDDMTNRLLTLDRKVMNEIACQMAAGKKITPLTDQQKACFKFLSDIDYVAGRVEGSTTTKKNMRHEIWSLISHLGAPSWYITLSPADERHPIAIYFAGSEEKFRPSIGNRTSEIKSVLSNPVAAARFFHFMVEAFLECVLGCGSDERGLYGDVGGYYGTVEQQGRLTLHLHLMLWLKGALSPQEVRDHMLDAQTDFQQRIITYLESVYSGDFMTGNRAQVVAACETARLDSTYVEPSLTLPTCPPRLCLIHSEADPGCSTCDGFVAWRSRFKLEVDDLLLHSYTHDCNKNKNKDGSIRKDAMYKGCTDNKWNKCKSRFPRPLYEQTMIDKDTGTLYMKKQDPWINTFTHELTYISRCNTDVTCLNSGTAIKAVVVYVSDYITKAALKTHVIFDAIVSILDGNKELVNGTQTGQEKARKLLTKIVNLLSTKMEMGSPMICMYLLGNPDHYTAHQFLPLYWQPFVSEVRQYFDESSTGGPSFDKVALIRKGGRVVGLSPVFDYIYRPGELEHISLYDWVRLTEKKTLKQLAKRSKSNKNQPMCEPEMSDDEDIDIEAVGRNVRLKSNCFKFHASHPLHATHGIRLRKHSDKLVVNFLGSSLPRRDKGDYQYYCTTMLTLFKPWRSGKDLLCECSDWSVAFNEHSFTDRQKELMENFNVIYECLDARDDYRAQMRAGGDMSNSWDHFADDTEDPLAEVHEQQTVFPTEDLLADIDLQDGSSEMGRLQRRRILNMESMKRVLHTSFWNLPTQVKLPDMSKFVAPEGNVSSVEWKKRVLKERQLVLDGKGQSCDKEKKDGDGGEPPKKKFTYDKVEVVDKSFLEKRFSTGNNKHLINGCVGEFSLNREQEKAFRIIVNHTVCSSPQQLQMYIAGMGGTGKSQVLKAVAKFFSARGESGRIIILALTGNAATLLGGSTYHSVLGINERKSDGSLPQVRQRLLGVDYIFIDEVSMLSAQDLYRISVRLCKARDNLDTPFGGLNLIVAGDFAQLPPPMGGEYTALYSRNGDGLWNKEQEQSIGRSLWHGFTTVVILRQNMRQKEQTPADARFRTALENMHYKSCTMDDIAFLNTRLSSNISGMRSVCDSLFRDLPIITALNNHKDQINQTGTERFAIESSQKLLDFYSEDTILPVKEIQETEGGKTRKETNLLRIKGMTDSLQRILWGQTPSTSDSMVAPKLSLCYGMPIMIRTNLATEICITKGQEGTVYGWTSSVGSRKQRMLDTLFVKLTNPPNKVRIPGLPLNVVPITRSLVSTYCSLPDDRKVYISRSQVEVLPCFSMTDYASQGKTRPFNPVDIQNCRDFHGMYTALSRSATADGTIILQGFDPNKIRGGLSQTIGSRSLHKEYIALEFLDEITNRRYTGKLHKSVKGDH